MAQTAESKTTRHQGNIYLEVASHGRRMRPEEGCQTCTRPKEEIEAFPLIEAALNAHEGFAAQRVSIAEQVQEGIYPSSPANASSAFAPPVVMLVSAVTDLQRTVELVRYYHRRTILEGFAKALLLTLPALGPIASFPPLDAISLLPSTPLSYPFEKPDTVLASIDVLARLVLPLSQTWWGGYLVLTSTDPSEAGGATERKMALLREGKVDEAARAVAGTSQWERERVRSLLEREVRGAIDLLGVLW
ncbi:hypothetical protein KVT40_008463 [Elsinoe batatas]|uniref:Uncharacterized protein n=1 Tax=Elsinoe batatas TaxID=2601811 RepID=A0A8K0KU15_9PEZI|nr:hypothetical protein KVT40_008463 [Elsinoe batatas]